VEVRIGTGVCNNSLAELLGYDKGWSCSTTTYVTILSMRWSVRSHPAAAFRRIRPVVFIVCELVLVHLRCALLVLIMDRVAYAETCPVTTRVEVDEACPAAWHLGECEPVLRPARNALMERCLQLLHGTEGDRGRAGSTALLADLVCTCVHLSVSGNRLARSWPRTSAPRCRTLGGRWSVTCSRSPVQLNSF